MKALIGLRSDLSRQAIEAIVKNCEDTVRELESARKLEEKHVLSSEEDD